MGNTYNELKLLFPNWSAEYHSRGNEMDNNTLDLIFEEGLLLWYIKDCSVTFPKRIRYNKEKISYSELKVLYEMLCFLKIDDKISNELLETLRFKNYQQIYSNKILHKIHNMKDKTLYECMSFDGYARSNGLTNEIVNLIEIVEDKLSGIKEIFGDFPRTKIRKDIREKTNIIEFGIAFQRWKIILEKMQTHISLAKGEWSHRMYSIDNMLEHLQEYIYHRVCEIMNGFTETLNTNEIKYYNNAIDSRQLCKGIYKKLCDIVLDELHPINSRVNDGMIFSQYQFEFLDDLFTK
jgi:hypothetical protein